MANPQQIMSEKNSELYFLAIIPPAVLQKEINGFKQHFVQVYRSSHALKSPPHITVIPPFRADANLLALAIELFSKWAGNLKQFYVQMQGFRAFKPRVIYLKPHLPSSFADERNSLIADFYQLIPDQRQDKRTYQPHITIAFKDLSPSMFWRAWDEFKNEKFDAEFIADKLILLKYQSGQWLVINEFLMDK